MKKHIIARIYEPVSTRIAAAAKAGNRPVNSEVMAALEKAYPASKGAK